MDPDDAPGIDSHFVGYIQLLKGSFLLSNLEFRPYQLKL